jgi:hypothetical protein
MAFWRTLAGDKTQWGIALALAGAWMVYDYKKNLPVKKADLNEVQFSSNEIEEWNTKAKMMASSTGKYAHLAEKDKYYNSLPDSKQQKHQD